MRDLERLDAGRSRRSGHRGDRTRQVTASLTAVALTLAVTGVFAHKRYGLTLTADGLRLAVPLGTPPEILGEGGTYAFLQTQQSSGIPVAYDPCDPIDYVVNDALAPPETGHLVHSAVLEISAATGLVFRHAGQTDDLPDDWSGRLQTRRKPVLIAWTTPDVVPELAGRVAGVGGSTAVYDEYARALRYTTGTVALDAPHVAGILTREDGPLQVRAIVLHELGHLVGLDHVDDPGELMYADNVGRVTLGPGDRRGLAALGSGQCFH